MERFSEKRLEKMRRVLSGHVESGDMPGLVYLVSYGGEVRAEAIGKQSFDRSASMRRDTLFRIASISKPVVAVATMILIEDGLVRLDDPIDTWIPELANRQVLRSIESPLDETVPANRPITVRDVLTYRMGFGSVMAPPDTYPIQAVIRELRVGGDGPSLPSTEIDQDEWLRRLGSLPLIAQPGERWMYHVSGDLLGVLVSRVSGQRLGEFLKKRVFEPLGMHDTGFHVPNDKIDRLPEMYSRDPNKSRLVAFDGVEDSAFRKPPAFESGGGGLVSTVDDYHAFSRMLLNKGGSNNGRILSRASVELMTSDQLSPANREGSDLFFGDFSSWGLGVAVDTKRREIYHSPGRFGWTGGFGTTAYTDPANDLIGILFTQRMMESPEPPKVFTDFWTLAYAALE